MNISIATIIAINHMLPSITVIKSKNKLRCQEKEAGRKKEVPGNTAKNNIISGSRTDGTGSSE